MKTQVGILTLIALGLSVFSFEAQANIFVKDRREQRDPTLPILRSVGGVMQLDKPVGGTAFLVGECHIMTAYHVAFAKEKNSVTGDVKTVRGKIGHKVDFFVGLNPNAAGKFAEKTTATVVEFGNYVKNDFHGMTGDWAILKLDDCLGKKYGYLKYARPTEQNPRPTGDLMTVSFPESRSSHKGIAVEENCKAQDYGPVLGLIGIDCALEGGMSGAPVLERQLDGSWIVVGIAQQSMAGVKEILPSYTTDHRNQAVYATAFYEALDKVLATDGMQVPTQLAAAKSAPQTAAAQPRTVVR